MDSNRSSSSPETGFRATNSPLPVGLPCWPEVTFAPHILPSMTSKSLGDW